MGRRDKSVVSTAAAATATTTSILLKRENCKRTKHDSAFSNWKILIGPSDWEDYSLNKEGAEKYRTHNLPNCASCSGLYELGIAVSLPQSTRDGGKLSSKRIIPVYLGQADNVRNRLQQYGRDGAHLQNGCTTDYPNDYKGSGLFSEIFYKGFAIVYRWAPMTNKKDAEKTEAQLLNTFDYAWNKESNGARRPRDIHQKLDRITSSPIRQPPIFRNFHIFRTRQKGLRIKRCEPLMLENESSFYTKLEGNNILSRIFKFSRSRRILVSKEFGNNEANSNICGVALGQGSICTRPPVEGRKRCTEHKGRKVNGSTKKVTREGNSHGDAIIISHFLSDPEGISPTCKSSSGINTNSGSMCGVNLENGAFCVRQPILGRKRCEEHKGMRVNGHKPKFLGDNTLSQPLSSRSFLEESDTSSTCGAITHNGSLCRRKPCEGSKWCWQHKGMNANSCARSSFDN